MNNSFFCFCRCIPDIKSIVKQYKNSSDVKCNIVSPLHYSSSTMYIFFFIIILVPYTLLVNVTKQRTVTFKISKSPVSSFQSFKCNRDKMKRWERYDNVMVDKHKDICKMGVLVGWLADHQEIVDKSYLKQTLLQNWKLNN